MSVAAWPSASAYGPSLGMAGVHSPQRARTTPACPSLVSRSIPHRARPLAWSHARALPPHAPASCPGCVSCFAGLCGSCSARVHRDLRAAALARRAPRPGPSAPPAWRRGCERGASGVVAAAPTVVHRCTSVAWLGGLVCCEGPPEAATAVSAGPRLLGSTMGPHYAVGVRGVGIGTRGGRCGSAYYKNERSRDRPICT